jgi:hypothetical protein
MPEGGMHGGVPTSESIPRFISTGISGIFGPVNVVVTTRFYTHVDYKSEGMAIIGFLLLEVLPILGSTWMQFNTFLSSNISKGIALDQIPIIIRHAIVGLAMGTNLFKVNVIKSNILCDVKNQFPQASIHSPPIGESLFALEKGVDDV